MLSRCLRQALLFAALLLLQACVVVPHTREVYDPGCRTLTRQITLEAAYLGGFHACVGEGCVALLVTVGAVTAASVVVSGSIALIGNVVYWFEMQGRCQRGPLPREPAAPVMAPPAGPGPAPSSSRSGL
jgi:hypothetical protein